MNHDAIQAKRFISLESAIQACGELEISPRAFRLVKDALENLPGISEQDIISQNKYVRKSISSSELKHLWELALAEINAEERIECKQKQKKKKRRKL